MTTRKIIGICGFIGHGKGTAGDFLQQQQFQKISFADKLKDGASVIFGWPRHLLEGDTQQSREFREQVDEYYSTEFNRTITPRIVLQEMGTDAMRHGIHDNVWVSVTKKTIQENHSTNYVIPDTRFPNEVDALEKLGGQLWMVLRHDDMLPPWWDIACNTNQRIKDANITHTQAQKLVESGEWGGTMWDLIPDVHVSEWAWIRPLEEFDHVLYNSGTIEELHQNILSIIS